MPCQRKTVPVAILPVNLGQGGDPYQQWDKEGSSFTAASLGHTNDITVLQTNRDGLTLDRSRFLCGPRDKTCEDGAELLDNSRETVTDCSNLALSCPHIH